MLDKNHAICRYCGRDIHRGTLYSGFLYWTHTHSFDMRCDRTQSVLTTHLANPKGVHSDPLVMEVLNG